MTETDGSMLQWALEYARRGWYVFPVHGVNEDGSCTCGLAHGPGSKEGERDKGKHPVMRNGLKGATVDEAKVREWWGSAEGARWNIGLRTGEVSGLTVLDVDIGDGKAGGETWSALVSEKGEPDTLMAVTGSGGAHAFFAYNSALNTSSNTLGPGVDCRNDGGYVVAAPSRHRSGGTYGWVDWDAFVVGMGGKPASLPQHLSKRVETRGRKKGDAVKHKKYTVEQVRGMLEHIDAGDRDLWRSVGIILGREFVRSDEAWEAYVEWSATWGGAKGRNHDDIMRQAFYELSMQGAGASGAGADLSLGTVVVKAIEGGWVPEVGDVAKEDFVYYGPGNNFFYKPTASLWIAEAVNAAVGLVQDEAGNLQKASLWIQKHALATSMSKLPGIEAVFIRDKNARDGVLFDYKGGGVINTYRAADIELGDARCAGPFLEHVARVFPREGDAEQFLCYMAHRAQNPAEKPRFALLVAGEMGTGKDTAVEFCVPALGPWNVKNIEPATLDSAFNEYAAAGLVRISEAANLQDMNKWAFNERIKVLIAGNPDVVTINPKYGHQYDMRMYCGVIITTNHLATGIYIPPGDRRYDVIDGATLDEMGLKDDAVRAEYFGELWDWYGSGGASHVAAWLFEKDVSRWSASNGQRKTEAHKQIVSAGLSSEHWLLDALDVLGNPSLVRGDAVVAAVEQVGELQRKDAVARLSTAMNRLGYGVARNMHAKDGRWKMEDGKLVTVFFDPGRVTLVEALKNARVLRNQF